MSKSVKFSRYSKRHDGSITVQDEVYSIIGAYFGVTQKNIKKIGMTSEEIDRLTDLYVKNRKTTEGLSIFLKSIIKSKKIGADTIPSLKTAEDVKRYPDYFVDEAITNLESAVENAKEKTKQKFVDAQEEMRQSKKYREIDVEWEKTCVSPICYDRRCCLDMKAKKKLAYKVALIRSGSLDYSMVLPVERIDRIYKLIAILKEGKGYETGVEQKLSSK